MRETVLNAEDAEYAEFIEQITKTLKETYMDSQHLLVPVKVQALVIDDIVFQKRGVVEFQGSYYANDGRWSPQLFDYDELATSLLPPGPKPFYGASRSYQGH